MRRARRRPQMNVVSMVFPIKLYLIRGQAKLPREELYQSQQCDSEYHKIPDDTSKMQFLSWTRLQATYTRTKAGAKPKWRSPGWVHQQVQYSIDRIAFEGGLSNIQCFGTRKILKVVFLLGKDIVIF